MAKSSIFSIADLIKYDYVWAVGTAEEINSKQLGWAFVVDYPLVTSKRIQVRNIAHLAPRQEISDYAQAMKAGDQFPPVIVTQDGWLVDGHTRTEAAKKIGWDTFPALVLNVNYGDLDPKSPLRKTLLKLGAAQNNKHGRRMTAADVAALIEQVAEGETPKQIQRDMHVGYSTANTVWNAARAKRKAESLGITVSDTLSNSHLKLMGGKLEKYTDEVWGAVFSLMQDAHLGTGEMNALVLRVEALHTTEERLRLLNSEREQHQPAINATYRIPPSQARRVKQGLGFLLKRENTPDLLVEKDPVKAIEYRKNLMDSRQKIDEILFYQDEFENQRTPVRS